MTAKRNLLGKQAEVMPETNVEDPVLPAPVRYLDATIADSPTTNLEPAHYGRSYLIHSRNMPRVAISEGTGNTSVPSVSSNDPAQSQNSNAGETLRPSPPQNFYDEDTRDVPIHIRHAFAPRDYSSNSSRKVLFGEVPFYHANFSKLEPLVSLRRADQGGIHWNVAYYACSIVACNIWQPNEGRNELTLRLEEKRQQDEERNQPPSSQGGVSLPPSATSNEQGSMPPPGNSSIDDESFSHHSESSRKIVQPKRPSKKALKSKHRDITAGSALSVPSGSPLCKGRPFFSLSPDPTLLTDIVSPPADDILRGRKYYFHYCQHRACANYPFVGNFENWNLPQDKLPRPWASLHHPDIFDFDSVLSHDSCRFTGSYSHLQSVHIIPKAEHSWYTLNNVSAAHMGCARGAGIDDNRILSHCVLMFIKCSMQVLLHWCLSLFTEVKMERR
ncbi:hypothetical protein F5B19DRAFT_338894 [Rostrohypoxylon terebratum]|nr:hypothetical protein F5B19DRAFT_338894 [Rostrohypoxylon terebratum]